MWAGTMIRGDEVSNSNMESGHAVQGLGLGFKELPESSL